MLRIGAGSGTGSYPDGPNGRQRVRRRTVRSRPRRVPCTSNASCAYAEHDGKNRQGEGRPSNETLVPGDRPQGPCLHRRPMRTVSSSWPGELHRELSQRSTYLNERQFARSRSTSDQVQTVHQVQFGHHGAQTTPKAIAGDRVADGSVDRERHLSGVRRRVR